MPKAPPRDRCVYCEEPFESGYYGSARTKDHVIPRSMTVFSESGKVVTGRGNIVEACGRCNGLKGAMLPSAIRAMAQEHRKRATLLETIADRVDELIIERRLLP